jgi:hypothetical protein
MLLQTHAHTLQSGLVSAPRPVLRVPLHFLRHKPRAQCLTPTGLRMRLPSPARRTNTRHTGQAFQQDSADVVPDTNDEYEDDEEDRA